MNKRQQLLHLKKELESRQGMPLINSANDVVFGNGNLDSKLLFIGEAAGYWESVKHQPFVGNAGKLLDELLESVGIKREEVYVTNIIKARPPENRDPEPSEIEAFQPYIDEEIKIIDPEVIVTLGRFSMNKFLPNSKISVIHGRPFEVLVEGKERIVLPMFHPAAALRADEVMKKIKEDFKVIKKVLEGEVKEEKRVEEKKEEPRQLELI